MRLPGKSSNGRPPPADPGGTPMLHVYMLTLSRPDRQAFDWLGDRYGTGEPIAVTLRGCLPDDAEWTQPGGYHLPDPRARGVAHRRARLGRRQHVAVLRAGAGREDDQLHVVARLNGRSVAVPTSRPGFRPGPAASRPGPFHPASPRKRAGRLPCFRGDGHCSCRSVQYRHSGEDYRHSGEGFTGIRGRILAPTTGIRGRIYRHSGEGSESQSGPLLDLRLPYL